MSERGTQMLLPRGDGTRLKQLRQKLPPLTTGHCWPHHVSREEVNQEGKDVFGHFLLAEVEKEGLKTPQTLLDDIVSTPEGYANPKHAKVGQELRMLGDDFERHKRREREMVRRRANEVGEDITEDEFGDLLKELLGSGITTHRILMLFIFCSDVVIHVLKKGAEAGVNLAKRFLSWSLKFIMDSVCSWVLKHGGWGQVLFGNTMKKYLMYAGITVTVGFIGYMAVKRMIKVSA